MKFAAGDCRHWYPNHAYHVLSRFQVWSVHAVAMRKSAGNVIRRTGVFCVQYRHHLQTLWYALQIDRLTSPPHCSWVLKKYRFTLKPAKSSCFFPKSEKKPSRRATRHLLLYSGGRPQQQPARDRYPAPKSVRPITCPPDGKHWSFLHCR